MASKKGDTEKYFNFLKVRKQIILTLLPNIDCH